MRASVIFLFISVILSCSQSNKKQNDLADRIDKYMHAKVEFNNFSGAILVARNDSIILEKGYGLADREWNVPNTADTKFRIASNTKQFTAASILQLQEQGKLSLNDTLGKYFHGFEYGSMVTIHMLLTHSSGIQDYYRYEPFLTLKPLSISKDSMLALFARQLFDFLPGKDISYSNAGYFLLGLIIEKVSGQSYEDYLTQHIFKIAKMESTGIDRFDTILPKRAKGYQNSSNAFDDNYRMGSLFAVGSIYSTVEDIYKFEKALEGTSILSEASKKKMFTQYGYGIAEEKKKEDPANTIPQPIDPIWYHLGYGCWTDTFYFHQRIFTRGGTSGYHSTFYRFINDNVCVIVLENNEESPDRVAEPLSAILFGADFTTPIKHEPCKINPEILKRYTGKWVGNVYDVKWTIEILIKDNKLYRRIEGFPDLELIPESDIKFFYADGQDKQFEFVPNKNGEITQAWFTIDGIKFRRDKIAS